MRALSRCLCFNLRIFNLLFFSIDHERTLQQVLLQQTNREQTSQEPALPQRNLPQRSRLPAILLGVLLAVFLAAFLQNSRFFLAELRSQKLTKNSMFLLSGPPTKRSENSIVFPAVSPARKWPSIRVGTSPTSRGAKEMPTPPGAAASAPCESALPAKSALPAGVCHCQV